MPNFLSLRIEYIRFHLLFLHRCLCLIYQIVLGEETIEVVLVPERVTE